MCFGPVYDASVWLESMTYENGSMYSCVVACIYTINKNNVVSASALCETAIQAVKHNFTCPPHFG